MRNLANPRERKITNFDRFISGDEYVVCLQVSVHDSVPVAVVDALKDLVNDAFYLLDGDLIVLSLGISNVVEIIILHELLQIFILIFINYQRELVVDLSLDHFRDIWVVQALQV